MKHSFRKRMIAAAIATLLAAPAWTATVTADEAAKARSGAQSGNELRSDTGSSSRTGTSQSDTALGSGTSTTAGASTSGTAGTDTSKSGTAYGSSTGTTSGSAGMGTTAAADNSTSKSGTAYGSGTGTSQSDTALGSGTSTTSGSAGASTSAAGTDSARSMSAGTSKADNPLYSRTADDLVGSEIVDSTGDDIGEIEKIVLSQDRRGAHAVVSVGGFLGIGEHEIAVSLDELQPAEDSKWRLSATKEQLKARPRFQSEQYVDLNGDQPISGSITDFAAFETDRNRTGMSRDSDTTSRMDKSMDKSTDKMLGKDKDMRQPSTGSGAAGASRDTSGSATTGGSATK